MPAVHFLDVTNRDGVQTARLNLSKFGKTMVNFYLGKLGVSQSELGFPFLFHEVPYVRANLALAKAGAFGGLKLSGWARAVAADVERSVPLGLEHMNLSISTSDQMIRHKFQGRLDRASVLEEMTAATRAARAAGVATLGVNAEDASRTDDGYLLEFAQAARDAGADRVRYCDTIGGDTPPRIRERFANLAGAAGIPLETHCHNDLGMAVANSVAGALGTLDAGHDVWVNTCVNGIGERAGNAGTGSACRSGSPWPMRSTSPGRGASGCGPAMRSASRCRSTSRASAATPSPTSRASTRTARSRTATTTSSTTTRPLARSRTTGRPPRGGWS
jgi:homocitrate synthase NifV